MRQTLQLPKLLGSFRGASVPMLVADKIGSRPGNNSNHRTQERQSVSVIDLISRNSCRLMSMNKRHTAISTISSIECCFSQTISQVRWPNIRYLVSAAIDPASVRVFELCAREVGVPFPISYLFPVHSLGLVTSWNLASLSSSSSPHKLPKPLLPSDKRATCLDCDVVEGIFESKQECCSQYTLCHLWSDAYSRMSCGCRIIGWVVLPP